MAPLNSQQGFPVIHESEARGDSPAVSHSEFQGHAARGQAKLGAIRQGAAGATGVERNLGTIKNNAWRATRSEWGGVTVSRKTGQNVNPKKGYAMATRDPGMDTVSTPISVSREQFDQHIEKVVKERAHLGTHIGVFRDDDKGTIDYDPVAVVSSKKTVRDVGSYTHSVGGAYDYSTGDGVFPPHVKDGQ